MGNKNKRIKNKRKLSEREKKFIRILPYCNSIRDAMIKSGYSVNYANAYCGRMLERDTIRQALLQELESQGLNPLYIVKITKQAIDDCITEKSSRKLAVLQRFLDMVLKITGAYAPEKKEIEKKEITITASLDEIREARRILEEKERELREGKDGEGHRRLDA